MNIEYRCLIDWNRTPAAAATACAVATPVAAVAPVATSVATSVAPVAYMASNSVRCCYPTQKQCQSSYPDSQIQSTFFTYFTLFATKKSFNVFLNGG